MLVLILDVQLNPDYMCQEESKKRVVIISVNSDGSVYEQLLKHCEDLNIAFTELQEVMEKNQPKVQTLSGIIDLAKITNCFMLNRSLIPSLFDYCYTFSFLGG